MGRRMKRIEVRDRLRELDAFVFDGQSLSSVIDELHEIRDEYSDYIDVYFSIEPYGYDGAFEIVLYGKRMESDSEYEKRVEIVRREREKDRIRREEKREKEYQDYLRLKEKFEGA